MPDQLKPKYFSNLDALRSIACLIVLFAHTVELTNLRLSSKESPGVTSFFLNGGNGVQIFFTLSGFLITYLLLHEESVRLKVSVGNFYMRRILRIWPMYFFTLAIAFGAYPLLKKILDQDLSWRYEKIFHFLFLSNFDIYHAEKFFPGQDAAIVDITWSVSIEEQFYLLWPVILVTPWLKRMRLYIMGLLALIAVGFQVNNHNDPMLNYYSTWSCALNLICGGLLAYLTFDYIQEKRTLHIPCSVNLAVYATIGIIVIWQPFSIDYLIYRWFLLLAVLYVILDQTINKRCIFSIGKIPVLKDFSKLTYSVYLVHPMVQLAVIQTLRLFHIASTPMVEWVKFISIILLSIAASILTYIVIEKRFLGLKSRFA